MATIPTFMAGGIPRRNKMKNLGKLDHSGILKNQRIYLRVKIADFITRLIPKTYHLDFRERRNSYLCVFTVIKAWSTVDQSSFEASQALIANYICTIVSRRVKLLYTKKIRFELFLCIRNMNDKKLVLGNNSYILKKLTFLENLAFPLVF